MIYHEKNEVEYRIDLNLGDPKSRITKFKNFFKSKALKKISFDVLEATGTGINNENLMEMGLMEWNGSQLTIDFPKIFSDVQSSLVIIIFRTKFASAFIDKLIHRQISKVNSIVDGKLISHFELVLDYANMHAPLYRILCKSVENKSFVCNGVVLLSFIPLNSSLVTKIDSAIKDQKSFLIPG